jgi:hypothetical protein
MKNRVLSVETRTTSGCYTTKWIAALARKGLVLVAFDAEDSGDKAAQWWLSRLENAQRLCSWWKDANQMLQDGVDLCNDWIMLYQLSNCELGSICLDMGIDTPTFYERDG